MIKPNFPYGPQGSRPSSVPVNLQVNMPDSKRGLGAEKVKHSGRFSPRNSGLFAVLGILAIGLVALGGFQVSQAVAGFDFVNTVPPFEWTPNRQDALALASIDPGIDLGGNSENVSFAPLGRSATRDSASASQPWDISTGLPRLPEQQEDVRLKARLEALLAKLPPTIKPHVYVLNLETGAYVNLHGDEPVPAASVIKLPVLLAYLQDLDAGKIVSEGAWVYEPIHQAGGSGELQYKPPGQAYASIDLATIMIQASDNTATNILIDNLGGSAALDNRLAAWGLPHTYIRNWLPDLAGTNMISPREMARILYTILESSVLTEPTRLRALDILTHIHNNRLIPAGLDVAVRKQVIIAHKTGDIGTSLGDSAWVRLPDGRRYLLCVQAERPYNDGTAKTMIQQLSQQVYTAVASGAAVLKNANASDAQLITAPESQPPVTAPY